MVDLSKPLAIERAQVGRQMHFPTIELPMVSVISSQTQADYPCEGTIELNPSSYYSVEMAKRKRLNVKFQLSLNEATGPFFLLPLKSKRKSMAFVLSFQENHIFMELRGSEGELKARQTSKLQNYKEWISMELHFTTPDIILDIEGRQTTLNLPKKVRTEDNLNFGALPSPWKYVLPSQSDSLCLKRLRINGAFQDLGNAVGIRHCRASC